MLLCGAKHPNAKQKRMPSAQFTENPHHSAVSVHMTHKTASQPPCVKRNAIGERSLWNYLSSISSQAQTERFRVNFCGTGLDDFGRKEKYLEVEENIFMILLLGRPCSRALPALWELLGLKRSTHIIISHYTITTKNALIVC